MRPTRPTIALAAALGAALLLGPAAALAQMPPTIQSEIRAHPRLAHAIAEMQASLRLLAQAPDNFGGHKAGAMQDLRIAIHSLKRALFYRLNMDDAALERAELR